MSMYFSMVTFTDSKEIDANDEEVSNITASLTRKQAEAVRKRIDTLNESTKRKLNIQLPTSSKHSYYPADVRTIFPAQTSGLPSNSSTSRGHRPLLTRKSVSEGVQLLKQTSIEDDSHRHSPPAGAAADSKGSWKTSHGVGALSTPTLNERQGSEDVRINAGL